jgi:hypothetical protein
LINISLWKDILFAHFRAEHFQLSRREIIFSGHHVLLRMPQLSPEFPLNIGSIDWFKGKSKPETIDFPIEYGALL